MGGVSIWQLLIILVIVLLVFGTKRLSGLGSDLGNAIKGFRSAMKDGEGAGAEPEKIEEADAKSTTVGGPAAATGATPGATSGAAPGSDHGKPTA